MNSRGPDSPDILAHSTCPNFAPKIVSDHAVRNHRCSGERTLWFTTQGLSRNELSRGGRI